MKGDREGCKGVVFILIALVIFIVGEKWLRKKFNIGKRDKIRPRFVNNIHMWGELVLYVAFVASMFFVTVELSEEQWMSSVMAFFLSIELFRVLMECIYQKEQCEYIIHLFAALVLLLFVLVAVYTN